MFETRLKFSRVSFVIPHKLKIKAFPYQAFFLFFQFTLEMFF